MERVLIINDCKFESTILKDMLLNLGYEAEVTSELETFRMIKDYCPDIVIANLIMKENTGDSLIERIKNKSSDIRCFLSSCNNLDIRDFKDKKVDGVINTPVKTKKLEELLSSEIYVNSKNIEVKNETRKQIDDWMKKMRNKQPSEEVHFTFCPFCGKKLGSAGKFVFCPYCGNKIK